MTHKGDRETAKLLFEMFMEDEDWDVSSVNSILFHEQNFTEQELVALTSKVTNVEGANTLREHPNSTFSVKVKLLQYQGD